MMIVIVRSMMVMMIIKNVYGRKMEEGLNYYACFHEGLDVDYDHDHELVKVIV